MGKENNKDALFEWYLDRVLHECKPLFTMTVGFTPDLIKDVKFYPPAVKMTFTDGRTTTSVAQEGDEFDAKTGMMVCIMKYIWEKTNYNTALDKWIKKDIAQKKEKEEEAKRKQEEELRRKKRIDKAIKKKERKRQEQKQLLKEAFVEAMLITGDDGR